MVLRKLTMALLSIGVMLPGLTHALAIQNIKTKSALGEPFRAEVELSDIGDLTEEDIKVSLASPEDFQRLGIEQNYFLTELRFEVSMQAGRSVIKISSHKRVTEPFLDFVLRITWPNNTRLQEVTAFLDPPTAKSSQQMPVAAPVVVKQVPPPIVAPLNVEPPPMAEEQELVAEVNTDTNKTYQVKKYDTLWSIARRVRPSTTISVPEMMKVLHKANPQAFIANDINMLKNGEVLRVPALSNQNANTQVAAQAKAIVMPQAANKPLARQQIDATSHAKASLAVQKAPKAQMKLVAPTGNVTAKAGVHSKQKEGTQTAMPKGAVSVTNQKLVTKTTKMSHEVAVLEQKLKENDQKIALQNAKLAQLEAQLKARRLSAEQAAKQKMSEKNTLEKKALATMACAVVTQSFLATEAKAAPDAPAQQSGGSMMPIIGGVALIVIIAVIFFLKSKGKKSEPSRPSAPPPAPKPAAPAPAPEVAKQPVPVKPAPEVKKPADPLEEVQPYLEMERYPQAVGILSKALVQTPERADLHLKLLEIFVKQKDRQSFEEQFAKLELLGELEATVEAEKLKALLPPPPKVAVKSDEIQYEKVAIKPQQDEEMPSLEDLEKDFAMSLSQPNLKALDIEIIPDPVELQQAAVEPPKAQEIESLLNNSLEFSFAKEEKIEPPQAPALDLSLDLNLETKAEVDEKPALKFDNNLSLDSLDDFLAEHKVDAPVQEAPAPVLETSLDFEQALAEFKEEQKDEVDLNLTEGFELEEFSVAQAEPAVDTDLAALDVDFSIDETKVDAPAELAVPAIDSIDLSQAAAAFDQDLAQQLPDVAADDLDFDVNVASDDVVADLDKEFSFLASTDENATRLDLARAYADMGDRSGARDLLEEVIAEGNSEQKNEAQGLLMRIS
ncbi:FimV/HubP family polar landmark protein [Agitococcus lubricus]|uniref:FimV-like protein n=1 Tax=Agitococcus lubricus TaxID=1077255 RepID=A0A2T5IVP2_9GAMM|nr:FimV/HubP family polar landmark protein [Agitococcus lubricus]PTQ87963.1 FimV-like protein [Agitococcus lubricus]